MLWAVLTVAVAAGVAVLWWARRALVLVRIDGPSMLPTLTDGDQVLARRRRPGRVKTGQLVLLAPPSEPGAVRASDPGRLWFVKRLVATPGQALPPGLADVPALGGRSTVPPGHLVVLGDNPEESYDSRQEGYIPQSRIRGVVLRRL
jgi:signal peptidase I